MKKYSSALVLGLGSSGLAACRLLASEGTRVTAVDASDRADLVSPAATLKTAGVRVLLGAKRLPPGSRAGADFDVCVISPGIRPDSPWARALERRKVPIISEIELGASRARCPILAVTGSKGKSTLVKLCHEALIAAGKRSAIAGNYGPPLCGIVQQPVTPDWIVLEVSSFQLERVDRFHPRVGVILNVQPDHLDRHGDLAAYAAIKARIFARMTPADTGILYERDAPMLSRLARGRNRWRTFGESPAADVRYTSGRVAWRAGTRRRTLSLRGTRFDNPVLGLAAAAAVAAIHACGAAPAAVADAARRFVPLPHRMNEVTRIRGVRFINDSKATSLTAMMAGIEMCGGPVRLIAGGLLKETDLELPKKVLEQRVQGAYLIGKASLQMEKAWRGVVPCHPCRTLGTAVRRAFRDARQGETVLLSPACASFDQFKNFEDRGCRFEAIVQSIRREK